MGILRRFARRRKGDAPQPLAVISPHVLPEPQPELPDAAGDPKSTASSTGRHTSFQGHRDRSLMQRERGFSVIVAPLRVEEGNAWQAFLLGTCNNLGAVAQWLHRLGLPPTSVADKMPYWREAVENPSRVTLRPHMQTAMHAASTGTWTEEDTVERPKPHFRTSAPGIKAMLAANFLLLYICFTVKV